MAHGRYKAWQAWRGRARPGEAGQGRQGKARPGTAGLGLAGLGSAGGVRRGKTGHGRHGMAGLGVAGQGKAGEARLGKAWQGRAWQARLGRAGHGRARLGMAGEAGLGKARRGRAWQAGHGTMRPLRGPSERETMSSTVLLYPRVPHMCNDQDFGLFTDQVIMHPPAWMGLSRKEIAVDRCMQPVIQALWDAGIVTRACCCGHGRYPPSVYVEIGDERFPTAGVKS